MTQHNEKALQPVSSLDETALDTDTRIFIAVKAENIRARMKRDAEDIIANGQDLIEVRERLAEHGQFQAWVQQEFGMSLRTAYRFIHVAEKYGDRQGKLPFLLSSALYELAAPGISDKIIEQVESGEIELNLKAIREAKLAEEKARKNAFSEKRAREITERRLQEAKAAWQQAEHEIETLQKRLTEAREEAAKPKIKEVIPPEIQQKITHLENQRALLREQRDNLAREVERLAEEMQGQTNQAEELEHRHRKERRFEWIKAVDTFYHACSVMFGSLPTPDDIASFKISLYGLTSC